MQFARTPFAQFISSGAGRLLRVVAGLGLIGAGYALREEPAGVIMMIVGLAPLAAGTFDLCLLSPLFGGPLAGSKIRATRSH